MDRPFAVGDMVVCHLKEGSRVGVIKTINPYFSTSPCFINFGSLSLWIPSDHIITIRSPRKGGKEARDIVAKLGRFYRESSANTYHSFDFTDGIYSAFESAKSMLET